MQKKESGTDQPTDRPIDRHSDLLSRVHATKKKMMMMIMMMIFSLLSDISSRRFEGVENVPFGSANEIPSSEYVRLNSRWSNQKLPYRSFSGYKTTNSEPRKAMCHREISIYFLIWTAPCFWLDMTM